MSKRELLRSHQSVSGTHQKVPQDPTGTPDQPIRPPLDSALMFVKDENGSALHHPSLPLDESSGDSGYHPPPRGLEDEESVVSRFDVAPERRIERRGGSRRWHRAGVVEIRVHAGRH